MGLQKRTCVAIMIVGLAVAISLYLPFYLDDSVIQKLNAGTGFIGAVSTTLTLLIALYLFNRFGLENEVMSKKAAVVFDLMNELKQLRFFMSLKHGGFIQYFPSYYESYKQHATMEQNASFELLFTFRYSEKISKITDLMNNIFMPLSIREKLAPMCEIMMIQSVPIKDNHLCLEMTPMVYKVGDNAKTNAKKNDERLKNETYGLLNNKVMTFSEFKGHWESAIEETKSWLKAHSLHHEINL